MAKKITIEAWIKKAKRLMAQCQEGYWLFAASNSLHVMKSRSDGSRGVMENGGMDPSCDVATIAGGSLPGPEVDGGDW